MKKKLKERIKVMGNIKRISGRKGLRQLCSMILVFGLALSMGTAYLPAQTAKAYYDTSMTQFKTQYLDTDTFDVKGIAYLVGTDNIAKIGSTQTVYSVPEGTKIQGHTIKAKYLPQDNNQTVRYIWTGGGNVVGGGIDWISDYNTSAAFLEYETAKFKVLDYDDEWVIVWSNGYSPAYSLTEFHSCAAYLVQTAHRPGFYRVKRSQVWIDVGRYKSTTPADGEKVTIEAEGKTTKSFVGIRLYAGIPSWGDSYRVPINTNLQVVSTEPVESKTKGDTHKYYKVYFNGKNSVNYMTYKKPGYYYVDARYVNLYNKGKKVPSGSSEGKIFKLSDGKDVSVYEKKDTTSTVLGALCNDALVDYFAEDSDDTWIAIWFNSKKAYIKSTNFSKSTAVSSGKKITNMHVKDIVNNQYIVMWDDLYNSSAYTVGVATSWDDFCLAAKSLPAGNINPTLVQYDKAVEDNYYTVKNSCFKNRGTVDIIVYSDLSSKSSDSGHMTLASPPKKDTKPIVSIDWYIKKDKVKKKKLIGKNYIKITYVYSIYDKYQLQYSTDKDFKDAKTINKSCAAANKHSDKPMNITGLKANTTYYFRQRSKKAVNTDAGTKYLIGSWSNVLKVKTKAK